MVNKTNYSSRCGLSCTCLLLRTENEVTQVMISKLSGIDVMTVSQILKVCWKKDFVKRQEHSRDTRAKAVILNEKARLILKAILKLSTLTKFSLEN